MSEHNQKIKYGELHMYYPLKFETKKKYVDVCKAIKESKILFSDEYQEKIMNALGYSLSQTIDDIKKELENMDLNQNHVMFKMPDYDKYKKMQDVSYEMDSDSLQIVIENFDSSIKLHFFNTDIEELNQRIIRLQREEKLAHKFYGENFTNLHNRYVLLPLKISLNNSKIVWMYPILYVFANKMGILKLELLLKDVDTSYLKRNDIDAYIKDIKNIWKLKDFSVESNFSSLAGFYLDFLCKDCHLDIIKYNNELKNIILVDFEGIPKQINSIPKEDQEELFRIVAAPVPTGGNTSYVSDAIKYIQENGYGEHGIKYIVKTTGGCLSLIDKRLLDYIANAYKDQINNSILDEDDHFFICNTIASDISSNVEFVLLIIVLKKINERNDYYMKTFSVKKILEIRKEYNLNNLFIAILQETCFGSVSEQMEIFEKRMDLYLKTKISRIKQEALDNILDERKQQKEEQFQEFLSIGSFFITLIFGLPAVYETLKIIRNVILGEINNIPFITLENLSVFLWILLILFVGRRILIKRNLDKKPTKIINI